MKVKKIPGAFLIGAAILILGLPPYAIANDNNYCDGHREGHKAGSDVFGMGYSGYPGCPGDPGSYGGNSTPYQRGYAAGMNQSTREICSRNSNHQNCK